MTRAVPQRGLRLAGLVVVIGSLALLGRQAARASTGVVSCDLGAYRATDGLTASERDGVLSIEWTGDEGARLRLQLAVEDGTPTWRELAVQPATGSHAWRTVVTHARPDFRVVSGLRRITNQQLDPLAGLGVPITEAVIAEEKWRAFWDAPLNVPGGTSAHNNVTPPQHGVLSQPGLPRSPSEIVRAPARYAVTGCSVTTDGARLVVSFPGVTLGVFEGRLEYTIFRGTNLIRQDLVATTTEPSVAYKYDAGLGGLPIGSGAGLAWRDVMNRPMTHALGGAPDRDQVVVRSGDRILAARTSGGAMAAMPPPHTFFWAREISYNLGYGWYRQDDDATFSFGVRQPESEASPEEENRGAEDRRQNFALRSARPGTWQHMPVFFYVAAGSADEAMAGAGRFTRGDHFKALPGYEVMAAHFHMGLVGKARRAGGLGAPVEDLEVLRAVGVNIVGPIDGGGGFVPGLSGGDPKFNGDDPHWLQWSRGLGAGPEDLTVAPRAGGGTRTAEDIYRAQADYYEAAKLQSGPTFVVMPNEEMIRGDVTRELGGHTDVFFSHPVYWNQGRTPGQPLVESNPTYGRVYHVGNAADMIEMAHRENLLLFMPHPRTKGSAGFPDAIRDTPHFLDPSYRGAGFRWGMGLDGSETRLCEYRCLPLLDDMNNWVADRPTPPKYMEAISELYQEGPGDDVYANNPVNYVRLDRLPAPGDWTSIVEAFRTGAFFVTSGEVLIPSYEVRGSGNRRTIVADVEWTFPLDFVEVVWGDGQQTDRQIIGTTDLPAFGRHHFEIPFDATGRKWVRFAAWDSAGNGAFVMPIKLSPR